MNKAIVHGWKELEDMLTHDNSQFELHDLRKMIKRALFARQFLTDNKYKQPKSSLPTANDWKKYWEMATRKSWRNG